MLRRNLMTQIILRLLAINIPHCTGIVPYPDFTNHTTIPSNSFPVYTQSNIRNDRRHHGDVLNVGERSIELCLHGCTVVRGSKILPGIFS